MADNVTFTSGENATVPVGTKISADDASGGSGLLQRVKLAYSADGADTHIPADADGLLVNLGANNDVTVTATNLDIRDLSSAADSVAAVQSGNWLVRLQDGSGNALTSKAPGSERALSVAIVDGSGNQVTSFGGSGGTSQTDDAAFTPGSGAFTPVGGIVTADSVDSGDGGAFAMLANRQQKVTLYDSSGVELAVGGGTQYDEDTPHVSGDKVTMAGVVRADTAVAQSGTNGDRTVLITDASGRLHCNVGNTVTVTGTGGTFPVTDSGGSLTVDGAVSLAAAIPAGTNNIGDVDVLSLVPGTGATALGKAEDAAHVSGDTGVAVLTRRIDTPASSAGSSGDYATLDSSAEGALWVTPTPTTTGGLSIFRSLDLDETEEEIKATAGNVYTVWFTNTAASTRWLKFYNATAANVTVGTTTPVLTLALPGNASDDISGVFSTAHGLAFSTAITVAATTGAADNNTDAPGDNEVIVNIGYK